MFINGKLVYLTFIWFGNLEYLFVDRYTISILQIFSCILIKLLLLNLIQSMISIFSFRFHYLTEGL